MLKLPHIAAVCGVMLVAWSIAFIRGEPVRIDPPLNKRLDDAFQDIGPYVTVPPPAPQPRVVQTIRIIPGVVETPGAQVIPTPDVKQPVAKPTQYAKVVRPQSDICSVHRMRKVFVSRYTWRCKK